MQRDRLSKRKRPIDRHDRRHQRLHLVERMGNRVAIELGMAGEPLFPTRNRKWVGYFGTPISRFSVVSKSQAQDRCP